MDRRSPKALEMGTGGLLQSLSYIAGESGGAWLLGSWYSQGLPQFDEMLNNIYLNESILFPGGPKNLPFLGEVITKTLKATSEKKANGFNISVADVYSGLISQNILPSEVAFDPESTGLTLSGLAQVPSVQNYSAPIPIMISLQKDRDTMIKGHDTCPPASIWEWSIFESGTFAKNVSSFIRSDKIGSFLSGGKDQSCVKGGDSLPWVLATATAAYSQGLHRDPILDKLEACMESPDVMQSAMCNLLRYNILDLKLDVDTDRTHLTTPAAIPNPFRDMGSVQNSEDDEIYFTDVGPCEQIPLFSLLQKGRELDVIFALDATEGNTSWPSGLALSISASHARKVGLAVPETPNLREFQSQKNLTTKATFFGCYQREAPAIVYIPNHEVSYPSNFSYSKFAWTVEEQEAMLQNGFDQMTEGDLPLCVSCLLASRQKDSCDDTLTEEELFWPISRRDQCEQCFHKYCWKTPEGHQNEAWESASHAVDAINRGNLEATLDALLLG